MVRSRHALRALTLCGLVLGLMAFTAAAAHAEEKAHWWIVNKESKLVELNAQGTIKLENEKGTLLTKIAGVAVEFLCTAATLSTGGVLEAHGSISKGTKVKFTGCSTDLNGKATPACQPNNGGTEPGVIVTKPGHGLVVLFALETTKDDIVELLPDEGETFATIEMGKECSIGTKVPVIGKRLTLKDCNNEFLVEKVEHLVEQGPGTELWVISKTAEHVSNLDGSALAALSGEHTGLKWFGEPA